MTARWQELDAMIPPQPRPLPGWRANIAPILMTEDEQIEAGYSPEQQEQIARARAERAAHAEIDKRDLLQGHFQAISNGDGSFSFVPRTDASMIVGIEDYRAAVPAEIPWICRPIAYSGGVTLVSGPPKAGKSTLIAQLQHSRETGQEFLSANWPVQVRRPRPRPLRQNRTVG